MKIGRLSESALKRMAAMRLDFQCEEVFDGAGIGKNCAALGSEDDTAFIISEDLIQRIPMAYMGQSGIQSAANHLAAAGAEPIGAAVTALFPEDTKKQQIEQVIQGIYRTCKKLSMTILEGHTEVTEAVNQPLLSVYGVGKSSGNVSLYPKALPGQDIVVTKQIGLEGTGILAWDRGKELSDRFPSSFLAEAKDCLEDLSAAEEAWEAREDASYITALGEKGIYGALWEMSKVSGVGMEIEIEAIPVRQHTIEICEVYNLNPYQLMSGGSMLIVTEDGQRLTRELNEHGIQAAMIGRTTASKDKLIYRQGKAANLEITKQDECHRLYAEWKRK